MLTKKEKIKKSIIPVAKIILSVSSLGLIGKIFPHVSTASHRLNLIDKGVNLTGKDIDHIIPKNLGGADTPLNYQVVSSSLNRSWQDGSLIEKTKYNPTGMVLGLGGLLIPPLVPIAGAYCIITGIYELSKLWGENKNEKELHFLSLLKEQKNYGDKYKPIHDKNIIYCPSCNQKLVKEMVKNDYIILKCIDCGYEFACQIKILDVR